MPTIKCPRCGTINFVRQSGEVCDDCGASLPSPHAVADDQKGPGGPWTHQKRPWWPLVLLGLLVGWLLGILWFAGLTIAFRIAFGWPPGSAARLCSALVAAPLFAVPWAV